MYGNQIGAFIGKNFVVIGSFLNQIYAQNLSNYLNNEKNTIIELGGGYGKFAFYILKNTKNLKNTEPQRFRIRTDQTITTEDAFQNSSNILLVFFNAGAKL